MLRTLVRDAVSFTRALEPGTPVTPLRVLRTAVCHDGFAVLALSRLRAATRWVPGAGRACHVAQRAFFGAEIGKDVKLGEGVCLVHTLGVVVGGDAELGARVRLMSSVTIGTAKDNGYPRIGNDVTIGAGARVLGPVVIEDGAVIGANAVVLDDVPARATVVGVPARAIHVNGETPRAAA